MIFTLRSNILHKIADYPLNTQYRYCIINSMYPKLITKTNSIPGAIGLCFFIGKDYARVTLPIIRFSAVVLSVMPAQSPPP